MLISRINTDLISSSISGPSAVITFVDSEYLQLLEIFSVFWKKLNLNNLVIICLDQLTFDRINELGLFGVYVPLRVHNRYCFWKDRFEIINIIFKSTKKHIIHTDVDCFWFKNIIPQLEADDGDVYYSMGKTYPPDIVKLYGFVLCCGFFFVKYQNHTMSYFDNILEHSNSKDDQVMTNRYVLQRASSITDIDSNDSIFSKLITLDGVIIKTVRQDIITRWPKGIVNSSLFHPYLTGTTDEKIKAVTEYLLPKFIK